MINENDMCMCGHEAGEHHRSFFPGASGWYYEECEYEGYNETGGMVQDSSDRWIDHCHGFREYKFVECDLEALIDELEFTDPGIRQRIAELTEILKTNRERTENE